MHILATDPTHEIINYSLNGYWKTYKQHGTNYKQ